MWRAPLQAEGPTEADHVELDRMDDGFFSSSGAAVHGFQPSVWLIQAPGSNPSASNPDVSGTVDHRIARARLRKFPSPEHQRRSPLFTRTAKAAPTSGGGRS